MVYIGSLKFDDKLKKEAEQIVIFGAGNLCESFIADLRDIGVYEKIVGICDNNSALCNKKIKNISVYDLSIVLKQFPDADFIVYNRYAIEICEQLVNNGISRIHLIRR